MQTFLPYPNFEESARCLDRLRLGKQRVECLQIMRTLLGESKGWSNHPAVKMWRGYEAALRHYAYEVCNEWMRRGYQDACLDKILALSSAHALGVACPPKWLGDSAFHRSHQSSLLRKDPIWYSKFNWDAPDNLPYVWPN